MTWTSLFGFLKMPCTRSGHAQSSWGSNSLRALCQCHAPNFVSITVVLQLHEGTTPILVRILLRFLRRYKTVGTFCARWGHP